MLLLVPSQSVPRSISFGLAEAISLQYCGAAGIGEFILGLYTATRDRRYLAFAERVAGYLIAQAETEANGMKWTQAERRLEPDNVIAQTDFADSGAENRLGSALNFRSDKSGVLAPLLNPPGGESA
jgi:hypothetical protein